MWTTPCDFAYILKIFSSSYPILKRRIAWVLGKLVREEIVVPNADVWNILLLLLSKQEAGSDQVVRFAAASALRECVDVSTEYSNFDVVAQVLYY